MKKAVVVLPTYNEAGNIEKVIDEIFSVYKKIDNWETEIVVVDSKSPDKTPEIVKKLQKKYKDLYLVSMGKDGLGKAYLKGFDYAINERKAFVVFEMDADLSHDPKEIPKFLHAIEQGADLVIGSRYMKGGSIPANWPIQRKILSISANWIARLGFMKLRMSEWTNGYRAIRSWLVKDANDHIKNYSGYIFQIAFLDFAIKKHANITQIPIQFVDRVAGKSKINSAQTTFQTLWYILTNSSFIKFAIVGGIGFILDFAISYILIERVQTAVWLATLISTESAIISNFFLNNYWSFSHKKLDNSMSSYLPNFLKFNLVASGSIIIQTLTVHFCSEIFGVQWWYVYKIIVIVFVVIPYSYLLYNRVIWKPKR